MLGFPLERIAVDEGAAYGAALLGGVAAGIFADVPEAVGACVKTADTIEPEPEWVEVYASQHERFWALIRRSGPSVQSRREREGSGPAPRGADR